VSNQPENVPMLTTGTAPPVVTGTYTQIVLTRDGTTGLVSVYQDGTPDFSFTDSSGLAVLAGPTSSSTAADLTVFKDDGTGLGSTLVNETSIGDIARLRLYDGALTPSQVAGLDTVVVPEPISIASVLLTASLMLRRPRRNGLAGSSALRRRVS
jgi:hypothetical protein